MWTLYVIDYIFNTYNYKEFHSLQEAVDERNKIRNDDHAGIRFELIPGTCSMSLIEALEKARYSRI